VHAGLVLQTVCVTVHIKMYQLVLVKVIMGYE